MKLFAALFLILSAQIVFAQKLTVNQLTCEHLKNPIGLDVIQPRLSWKLQSAEKNTLQVNYSIRVATNKNFSAKTIAWQTGKTLSSQSVLLPYNGNAVEAGTIYYWQVKVWDNHNNESAWSDAAMWETGLLKTQNFKAKWIEPVQDTLRNMPAILLRTNFVLTKKIASAQAYVTAHGFYELYLNGNKVGTDIFTPGWTSYNKRLQYQTYDISNLLQNGNNAVGAMLGDGWYRGSLAWENNWGIWGKKLGLLCQLQIVFQDGSTQTIVSDESWKGSQNGPITINGIYNGETYDARKEISDWNKASFNDASWKPVNIAQYSNDNLIATQSVAVKKIQEIHPVKIFTTPKGLLVADFGQNMVGWVKLNATGTAGTVVTIKHSEILDKFGNFYTDNLRAALATATYVLKGGKQETYEPRFSFFGFRYIAIDGYPGTLKPEDITGVVIHSDMTPTGTFE